MYDGYYIYSPYKNTWDEKTIVDQNNKTAEYEETDSDYVPTYKDGENLYGLKPYVYYSCRYKTSSIDITITYSLDNYIAIQGYVSEGGKKITVSQYGYVLNMASNKSENGVYVSDNDVYYNGIKIEDEEPLEENIYVDGKYKYLPYVKVKGVKYYKNGDEVFSVLNGKKQLQNKSTFEYGKSNAKNYYKDAVELYNFIKKYNLLDLRTSDIEETGTGKSEYYSVAKIFDYDGNIEAEDSNFNIHKRDVIKNSITKNLSVAISNFNNYSGASTDFQMPKLKDTDWDKIMDNISVISFFQGANIGGKTYNGYSIVTNTKNEDVVMEDSIYIKTSDNVIHRITEKGLAYDSKTVGIFNVNLEKRTTDSTEGANYLPIEGTLSYGSIITQDNISDDYNGNIMEYIKNSLNDSLKKVYYTALARERYGLYRQQLWIPSSSNSEDNVDVEETYTVTYDANGGTGAPSPQTKIKGVTLKLSTVKPTKQGYEFYGWAGAYPDQLGRLIHAGGDYDQDRSVTLYAAWKQVETPPATYIITFHNNGGVIRGQSSSTIAKGSYTFGVGFTLPGANLVTREGYIFKGWYDNENFSGDPITRITETDTGDKDLYAKWITSTIQEKVTKVGHFYAAYYDLSEYSKIRVNGSFITTGGEVVLVNDQNGNMIKQIVFYKDGKNEKEIEFNEIIDVSDCNNVMFVFSAPLGSPKCTWTITGVE